MNKNFSCIYCGKNNIPLVEGVGVSYKISLDNTDLKIEKFDYNNRFINSLYIHINYCPMCGRNLHE